MITKTHRFFSAVIWGSLMAPTLLLASGCNLLPLGGCTQAGCLEGVTVSILGLEADQSYAVEVETPDEIVKCTLDTRVNMDGYWPMSCDNSLFYFSQLDNAQIDVDGRPDSVAITVRQAGTVIAQDEVVPEYDRSAPNGEACGPICYHADVLVEL